MPLNSGRTTTISTGVKSLLLLVSNNLKPPTDEEIVQLGELDPKLLVKLHEAHEGRIQAAEEDPLRYGFDLAG